MGTHINSLALGWAIVIALIVTLAIGIAQGVDASPDTYDDACYPHSAYGKEICFPSGERVTSDSIEDINEVIIKTIWYDSYEEVTAAYHEAFNPELDEPLHEDDMLEGWSQADWSDHFGLWVCELHLIKPEYVFGDTRMDALGHELYHCLVDGFHL